MHNAYPALWLRTVGATLALFLGGTLAVAQTIWSGTTDADWFTASNWSAGLPAAGNDAIVPGGSTVLIDGPLTVDFEVSNFGAITAAAELDIDGTFSNGGTLATAAEVRVSGLLENFGDLEVAPDSRLVTLAAGTFRSNGTLLVEGVVAVVGAFTNEGDVDVVAGGAFSAANGGEVGNPGVINVSGNFALRGGATYAAPSGGTLNVEAGGRAANTDGSTFSTAGVVDVEADGVFAQRATYVGDPGRTFVAGTFRTFDQSTTRVIFLTVGESGKLEVFRGDGFEVAFSLVNAGLVDVRRPVTVRGVVTNRATGTLRTSGPGVLDFVEGTNFENAGTVANGGVVRTVGTLTNAGTFTNTGTLDQRNGGTVDNGGTFVNAALISNVDRIVNDGRFTNRGTLTNGSGGVIENNAVFVNVADATIENLFQVYNNDHFVNRGFVKNGVSIFNDATFNNFGLLANVGDVFNNPDATFNNFDTGVVDNSGAGIFTNEGLFENDGEFNNFDCGILVNDGRFENRSWIQNEGIFLQNGTLTGKATMGDGPVVADGGTSPKICQPYTQKLDADGRTVVGAVRFAASRFDSCDALQYLIDGEEELSFTCADLGTREITFTLVDRRGNRVNCATTLTIVDESAPRLRSECPGDIAVADVPSAPAEATWTPPTFVDNCDDDPTVTSNFNPGDRFPEGSTVVTYTATDDAGNSVVCEFTVTVTVEAPACEPKDPRGLVAYYNFKRGRGTRVLDRSGYGEPLPLKVVDPASTTWAADCGLVNTGESIVRSYAPANKIGRALMMTRALTVEAWVRADKLQTGPERIVTYSENSDKRNFTLAQQGDRFVFRLKTSHTNDNGSPDRRSRAGAVKVGQLQHVAFTRSAGGAERLYVDGVLEYSGNVGGDFGNWGAHCRLSLFNENTLRRSFAGAIRNVAIYDRALSHDAVRASRERGACCDEGDDSPLGQVCEGPRGHVTYERFDGIGGVDLPWLYKAAKYPARPDATQELTSLDIPRDVGADYGSRTRGFLYPAKTGKYRLAVSGDDHTVLLVASAAGDPATLRPVARVRGWTQVGDLHKYDAQKSGEIHLRAGESYYFEILHKEKDGHDHATAFWKRPGETGFRPIEASSIGDVQDCGTTAPTEPAPCERGVLFVVGNAKLNAGDQAVKERLVASGYDVMVKDALWASADMAADKALVLISSTVRSSHVGTRFRHVTVPVLTYETYLYDDLGMTGDVPGTDFGKRHTNRLKVIGGEHPLAAGKRGMTRVIADATDVAYGMVKGSDAKVIAHVPADIWLASVFVYDRGDRMAGGMRAPATRIGFFLNKESPAIWTDAGRDLFDAAVRYAVGCASAARANLVPEVLELRAAQDVNAVRLDWTGGAATATESYLIERSGDDATYEVIDEVTAPATPAAFESFTYLDAAPLAGENFYRVTAAYADGGHRTSELRLVTFAELGQVGMFPNPAYDQVTISLDGFDGREVELIVTDALGQRVLSRTLDGDRAAVPVEVDHLPAGTYGVTLKSGDYQVTKVLALTRD